MTKDVRIYRRKVWVSGQTADNLLYLAKEMGVEPEEAFRRALDKGYEIWLRERRGDGRRKRHRRES